METQKNSTVSKPISNTPTAARALTRKFPSGEHVKSYGKYEKWTNRRWAWEFLCRNKEFRQRCDATESLDGDERCNEERKIAKAFHLKVFKHWKEKYGTDHPKFLKAHLWYKFPDGERSKKLTILMREDQVVIRFNLSPALLTTRALDAQIEVATGVLRRRLNELAAAEGAKPKATRTSHLNNRLRWLRLLDATYAGATKETIYEWIKDSLKDNKRMKSPDAQDDPAGAIDDMLRSAKDMTKTEYLTFAYTPITKTKN